MPAKIPGWDPNLPMPLPSPQPYHLPLVRRISIWLVHSHWAALPLPLPLGHRAGGRDTSVQQWTTDTVCFQVEEQQG